MIIASCVLLLGLQGSGDGLDAPELGILRLKFEISTPRPVLDPADLLPLAVRWTNEADAALKIRSPLFKVFMEEPGGRIGQAQASFGDIICGEGVTYELEPLEFVELNELRSPGFLKHEDPSAGGFQRPATGGWKVWGEFQHRYGVMKSNVLELRIEDDPARTPEVRQALGSEAWHRFALGGESTDADLLTFRKLALTKGDFPQKDILAYTVGLHDLNRSRPGHATTLFRIAGAAPSRNLGRTLLSSALAQCHWELGNYDEALAVMDQAPPGPRDIARKRWATQRAGVLRAKQTEELFQPR